MPAIHFLQPVVLVVDPYWLKKEHGISDRFDDICADNSLQDTLGFFRVHGSNIYELKQRQGSAAWFLVFVLCLVQNLHFCPHYLPVLFPVPWTFINSTSSHFCPMFTTHTKYLCIIVLTLIAVHNSFVSSYWLCPLLRHLHIPTSHHGFVHTIIVNSAATTCYFSSLRVLDEGKARY